jgi:predicted nucleic acid-binding protein
MLYYFDSSIILAILLDEKRKHEALDLWRTSTTRVSSLLLKLETITVLRRTYEHNKSKLESSWLPKKTSELDEYFQEINFRIIDEDIEKLIFLKKELSNCKTLDAIHIATAVEMSKIVSSTDFFLYTFDREMAKLAKLLKFKINEVDEKNYI